MKRFIYSVLCVSVFFAGLGALVEKAGARFKSDERALAIIQQARQALGGDNAINAVQSMRIVGQTTHTIKIDGSERTEKGDTEIAFQLPDKLMKMVKMGHHGSDPAAGDKMIERKVDVVVMSRDKDGKQVTVDADATGDKTVKRIIIKKDDGTIEELSGAEADKVMIRRVDGDKSVRNVDHTVVMKEAGHHDAMRHNEMLRLTLSLLLTAPQGMDVSYTFGGETSVDGTACNIVVAESGGSAFRIFLGKSSNLPVMMTFNAPRMPKMFRFTKEVPPPADGGKDIVVFRKTEGAPEMAEHTIKFSDYRSVNGVQLPYRWSQSVGGANDHTFEVTSYEINPANIAERFQNQKVMVRKTTSDVQ